MSQAPNTAARDGIQSIRHCHVPMRQMNLLESEAV